MKGLFDVVKRKESDPRIGSIKIAKEKEIMFYEWKLGKFFG